MDISFREKVLSVIKRKASGYVPFQFVLCPSQEDKFYKKYGHRNYFEEFNMPYYFLFLKPKKRDVDFSKYFENPAIGMTTNEFGVGFEPAKDGSHFTHMRSSMNGVATVEDINAYPYPDPVNDYDWDYIKDETTRIKAQDKITVGALDMTVFEISWYMWGMDRMLMDLYTEDAACLYHLDKITEIRCEMARQFVNTGIDVLHLGDDIATQNDMMMSPELWRELIKPRLGKVIDAAKSANQDILIDYHSDGNIEKVIPELIEIGVDILNPIQPECMNPIELKKKYGSKVTFRGCIGTQSVLPFGTAADVRREVESMIKNVGYNGGLILAPSHIIEPEVPWENIIAFVDTIESFNRGATDLSSFKGK